MFPETAGSYFTDLLAVFTSPQKRLFLGYLLSALLIALIWLVLLKKQTLLQAISRIFDKKVWLSRSARADYLLASINVAIMNTLAPRILSQSVVAYFIFESLHEVFAGRVIINLPGWMVVMGFTLFLFVLDDLARYWVHRMMHVLPSLWAFHKVHHSATSLNPLTVLRTHPIEGIVFLVRNAFVQGSCIAIFFFFFGDQVSLLTVLGAGIFNVVFNLVGSNLRHSSISIGFYRPLEKVFISPAQHQIHHSTDPLHIDKNFGVVFALWDYLWKTHCFSRSKQSLTYGISGQSKNAHTLYSLYFLPFIESFNCIKTKWINLTKVVIYGFRINAETVKAKTFIDDVENTTKHAERNSGYV